MKLRAQLYHRQNGRCFYCDRQMKLHAPRMPGGGVDPLCCTIDHVNRAVSVKLVVGACWTCNNERGCLPAHEYIAVHGDRLRQSFLQGGAAR